MDNPANLSTALTGTPHAHHGQGLPFLLTGSLLSQIPLEALRGIALNPDQYPSVFDDPELLTKLSLYIYDQVGPSNLSLPSAIRAESGAYGGERDLCVSQYSNAELSSDAVFDYPLVELDYKKLKVPSPETDGRMPVVLETMRLLKLARPSVPLVGDLVGALSLATSLISPDLILRALTGKPRQLSEFLDFLTDNTIAFAKAQARAGADIFFLIDPFASGEVLGPAFFESLALPYLNRIATALDGVGCQLIVHICGDVSALVPLFSQLDCQGVSLHKMPEGYSERDGKFIVGGLDSTQLLAQGGRPSLDETFSNVEAAALRGFSAIAPSCALDSSVSLAALRVAADAALRVSS